MHLQTDRFYVHFVREFKSTFEKYADFARLERVVLVYNRLVEVLMEISPSVTPLLTVRIEAQVPAPARADFMKLAYVQGNLLSEKMWHSQLVHNIIVPIGIQPRASLHKFYSIVERVDDDSRLAWQIHKEYVRTYTHRTMLESSMM